jgi:hypothetical protein
VILTSLIVAAVGVLTALAAVDALRSGGSAAPTAPTTASPSTEQEAVTAAGLLSEEDLDVIQRVGNTWAPLFAAGQNCNRYMGQPACERVACERVGGVKIRNCTPPAEAFRNSFAEATVQDIEIKDSGPPRELWVTFSNGEVVKFQELSEGDLSPWTVDPLAWNVGRAEQEIERVGNTWAPLFAAGQIDDCSYMTQPLCERIACERVGGVRIRNCTPPTSAFRNSFFGATVQEVVVDGGRAAASFSNGEVVELHGDAGTWSIHRLGQDAALRFFE